MNAGARGLCERRSVKLIQDVLAVHDAADFACRAAGLLRAWRRRDHLGRRDGRLRRRQARVGARQEAAVVGVGVVLSWGGEWNFERERKSAELCKHLRESFVY